MPRFLPMITAALLLVAPAAQAQDPTAEQVVAASREASGGAAWDALTGSYEKGVRGPGSHETWVDFTGYRMRTESGGPDGVSVHGFNGSVVWDRDAQGKVTVSRDPAALTEAITSAYSSNNGFFFPDRFPARLAWLRADAADGRTFDVIEAEPVGGRAFELWFDRATHLLGRIVDPKGAPPLAVVIGDYRRVGQVLIGFHGEVQLANGQPLGTMQLDTVVHMPVDPARYDPPAGP